MKGAPVEAGKAIAIGSLVGPAALTVPGVLLDRARVLSDRDYLHFWRGGEWRSMSWAEMAEKSLRVAGALVEAGLKPGDRVGLWSENRVEWLYCDLGIQAAGCVTVPIYPTSTAATVRQILDDSSCTILIASRKVAAHLHTHLPYVRIVVMETELRGWTESALKTDTRAEVARRLRCLWPEDIASIVYTAGTSGEPKGVILRHRNFVEMAKRILEFFAMGEGDVILSFLPYAHIMERVDGIFVPSTAGCSIWLARGFSTLTADIHAARPTVMLGVPRVFELIHQTVYEQVAKQSPFRRALFHWAVSAGARRLSESGPLIRMQACVADVLVLEGLRRRLTGGRLRFFISGGAPLNEKVERFFWAIGVRVLQGYGLTEATGGVTSNTESRHRYGTVGLPVPGIGLKVAPDGEVLVRGPAIMAGYHNRPNQTAEVLADGWLKTGDVGHLDPDGFLTITDRKKDLIKTSGGEYVAPLPIESRLQNDRYVRQAIVIGEGRPYVTALLVPDWRGLAADQGLRGKPDELIDDERVRRFFQRLVDECNAGLTGIEAIKRFALVANELSQERDELTPTLKPKRRVIAENFDSLIQELYAAPARPPVTAQ